MAEVAVAKSGKGRRSAMLGPRRGTMVDAVVATVCHKAPSRYAWRQAAALVGSATSWCFFTSTSAAAGVAASASARRLRVPPPPPVPMPLMPMPVLALCVLLVLLVLVAGEGLMCLCVCGCVRGVEGFLKSRPANDGWAGG